MLRQILIILGAWFLGKLFFRDYAFYKKWKQRKKQRLKKAGKNASSEVVKQVDGVDVILNPEKHQSTKSTFQEADNTAYTEI